MNVILYLDSAWEEWGDADYEDRQTFVKADKVSISSESNYLNVLYE